MANFIYNPGDKVKVKFTGMVTYGEIIDRCKGRNENKYDIHLEGHNPEHLEIYYESQILGLEGSIAANQIDDLEKALTNILQYVDEDDCALVAGIIVKMVPATITRSLIDKLFEISHLSGAKGPKP